MPRSCGTAIGVGAAVDEGLRGRGGAHAVMPALLTQPAPTRRVVSFLIRWLPPLPHAEQQTLAFPGGGRLPLERPGVCGRGGGLLVGLCTQQHVQFRCPSCWPATVAGTCAWWMHVWQQAGAPRPSAWPLGGGYSGRRGHPAMRRASCAPVPPLLLAILVCTLTRVSVHYNLRLGTHRSDNAVFQTSHACSIRAGGIRVPSAM